jgi:chitinase
MKIVLVFVICLAPLPAYDMTSKWISAYYVGWQAHILAPADIDYSALTHLIVFAVRPKRDGTIERHLYIDDTNGPRIARELAQRAHGAGKKPIICVGGAGLYDAYVGAASPSNRAGFVRNLLSLVDEWGYDGVDIDWEPLRPSDYANFLALARELRAARPNMILTAVLASLLSNSPLSVESAQFLKEIAPLFDQLNIMTYGMAGAWDGWTSWHSSPLYGEAPSHPASVKNSAEQYIRAGVPPAKLGLGVAFYGQVWGPKVTKPGETLLGNATEEWLPFHDIKSHYYSPEAYRYDSDAQAPYLSLSPAKDNVSFISYEDETSVAAKGRYAHDAGLGGTVVWELSSGHLPGAANPHALLQAVKAVFGTP